MQSSGTRKDIQEQDNAKVKDDPEQLVGVHTAGYDQGYTGYFRMPVWEVRGTRVESSEGETEQVARVETRKD